MINVPALEWHVTDACNFTCEGCAHFSNHGHSNLFTIKELELWYSTWSTRIAPSRIAILGGEPLLNKKIVDIIYLTKQYWNNSNTKYFELVTNGTLLHLYPELPKALSDTNCTLAVSMHHDNADYLSKFGNFLSIANEWRNKYNINVRIYNSVNEWLKIYNGFGDNILPFEDNNLELSWENCITGQQCWQLYQNKIYKCPMVAYLPIQKEKYNISEKWNPYLEYKPLLPEASDKEIINFFNMKAESVCSMCPAYPQVFKKRDPLLPIKFYKKNG